MAIRRLPDAAQFRDWLLERLEEWPQYHDADYSDPQDRFDWHNDTWEDLEQWLALLGWPEQFEKCNVPRAKRGCLKSLLVECVSRCNELLGGRHAETTGPVADGAPDDTAPGCDQQAESGNSSKRLPVPCGKAYQQYKEVENDYVQLHGGRKPKDEEAYAYWKKRDSELPSFDTWVRYLRRARRHYRDQKHSPRHNRPHGKSIVRASEVDNKAD